MARASKAKRQDQAQRAGATSASDATALGMMAGGLVLGVMQAEEAKAAPIETSIRDGREAGSAEPAQSALVAEEGSAQPAASAEQPDGAGLAEAGSTQPADAAPIENVAVAQAAPAPAPDLALTPEQPAEAQAPMHAGAPATDAVPAGEASPAASTPGASDSAGGSSGPIVADVSEKLTEQLTSGLERIVQGIEAGEPAAEISKAVSEQISRTVDNIVSQLNSSIGGGLGDVASAVPVPGDITEQLAEPGALMDEIAGALPDAGDLLADIRSDLPSIGDVTGAAGGAIAQAGSIPSTLLGAEMELPVIGALEKIFYRDGAAEEAMPAAPREAVSKAVSDDLPSATHAAASADEIAAELSDVANTVINVAPPPIGLIGQIVNDALDGPPQSNAFGLL